MKSFTGARVLALGMSVFLNISPNIATAAYCSSSECVPLSPVPFAPPPPVTYPIQFSQLRAPEQNDLTQLVGVMKKEPESICTTLR